MKGELIFSLDIGTRTIIGIVGEYLEDESFKVLAYTVKEHKKRNMFDGQIHDIEGVAKVVKDVVVELEEKTGTKLRVVSIAAAGRALKTHKIRVEQTIDDLEITRNKVEALELEAVQRAQDEMNQLEINKILKYYSIGYTVVDYYLDENRMESLVGHKGERIGVELLATFLPQIVIESLYTVISRVGLEVGSITLEPIAAINVAIKKELRLLNLALVDIGAGTSDIAITKDGQIISYAMTSTAGDEITERLAQAYLLDFNNSEKLKVELSRKEEHDFIDVIGVSHNLSTNEIVNTIFDVIEKIATEIADKIIEYNGKAPSAVFLVGGSSQMPMLKETIAEKLGLPKERVAIRDTSAIENIEGLEETNGPDMITPIGIAIEGAQDKYRNFIKVTFNGEEIRVFNTEDIKVSDVLVLTGYNPRDLMPKRSDDFIYYINGKKRIIRGKEGTHPELLVDKNSGNLKTKLRDGAVIDIIPSIVEPIEPPYLYDIVLMDKTILFDKTEIDLVEEIKVNDKVIGSNIKLNKEDKIQVNEIKSFGNLIDRYGNGSSTEEYLINGEKHPYYYELKKGDIVSRISMEEVNHHVDNTIGDNKLIRLVINDSQMDIYYKKDKFVFVDIFDHIDFDRSSLKGKLVLKVNGRDAEYMEDLKNGDNIKVYWE
ncbi:cell division FtsA domain-containing protein [Tissierella sp.]|uniref:cell division protein FtsA n=1 Tax=Tissierella sp. TaxID=41274 RepID=UPI00285AF04C|nr:cell division FtsA domain-containing protein [Tissierella sp.]MDR7855701.1 cell division FtsA domain-containing protein [Tissierella sp.]